MNSNKHRQWFWIPGSYHSMAVELNPAIYVTQHWVKLDEHFKNWCSNLESCIQSVFMFLIWFKFATSQFSKLLSSNNFESSLTQNGYSRIKWDLLNPYLLSNLFQNPFSNNIAIILSRRSSTWPIWSAKALLRKR